MSIVLPTEAALVAALRRNEAAEEDSAQRLMEDDARIESVLARQRFLETAKRDRADEMTSQIKGTRGPGIGAQVLKLLSPGRKPRIDEIDDPDILDAILVSLQDDRAAHAAELKADGVATERSRQDLLKAQTLAAFARVTVELKRLVGPVGEADRLLGESKGLWPQGWRPAVCPPVEADGAFRSILADGLSGNALWQSRARQMLEPFVDEIENAEREELQHA